MKSEKALLTSDFQLLFAGEPISGRQGGGEGSADGRSSKPSACFITWPNP